MIFQVEAVPWTFSLDPILTSLESSSVQLFYGWRLYKSCRSAVLPTLVVSCALLGFLAAIGSSVVGFEYKTLAGYLPFKWLLAIWLGSAVSKIVKSKKKRIVLVNNSIYRYWRI